MIEICCKNNKISKSLPEGLSLLEISKNFETGLKFRPVCALVENKLKGLGVKIYTNTAVEFLDTSTTFGSMAYSNGAFFILSKAVQDLFPGTLVKMAHPVSNGIYCPIMKENLTEEDVNRIRLQMDSIISDAIPFVFHKADAQEVIKIMNEAGRPDAANLIETTGTYYATYYTLAGMPDCYYGCLPPDTSFIYLYSIDFCKNGVILRVPDRKRPDTLPEMIKQDKMFEIFNEYHSWQEIIGISTVSDLNKACQEGRKATDLINVAEALQTKKIVNIADTIRQRREANGKLKLILISGPSSSGKTTFSKRLQVQLMANGLTPKVISLDDYFVDQTKTPRDESGDYDFESLYALDLPLFAEQTKQLLSGEEVSLPTYNFHTGKQEFLGKTMKLEENDILVMEGIHALNPELTPQIPSECKFLIYVSALTTLRLDEHNYIKTTDNRLLRRTLRDFKYRSYSAKNTIARWPSVRAGEEKWIFPYQENADAMFNSALLFEIAVIKSLIDPILEQVPRNCQEFAKAYQLRKFLGMFTSIPSNNLPPTSLAREFIGGSSFHY